jgi:hypothetical protein
MNGQNEAQDTAEAESGDGVQMPFHQGLLG